MIYLAVFHSFRVEFEAHTEQPDPQLRMLTRYGVKKKNKVNIGIWPKDVNTLVKMHHYKYSQYILAFNLNELSLK